MWFRSLGGIHFRCDADDQGDGADLGVGGGAGAVVAQPGADGPEHGPGEGRGRGGKKWRTRLGMESTHWRIGSGGKTWS